MSHNKQRSSLCVVDLFSGAGGLSLGAARAGFFVKGAVDNDQHATATHQQNFPASEHISASISELQGSYISHAIGLEASELTGIIGGPPCQGFSNMGKREELDGRNNLFIDFFRLVSELKPKFFLAENVPGILKEKYARIRAEAFAYIEGEYTLLPPMLLTASDYGAPTSRKRVFFYGYLKNEMHDLTIENFKPFSHIERVTVKAALCGLPVKIKPEWQDEAQGWRIVHCHGNGYYASRLHGYIPLGVGDIFALNRLRIESRASGCLGTYHSKEVADRYARVECGKSDTTSKSFRLELNGFCPTLRAGTNSDKGSFQAVRPLHPTENRVITPREAARLQGFPDWFRFAPTKWHSFRQIGSSVSPIVAEQILTNIIKALN